MAFKAKDSGGVPRHAFQAHRAHGPFKCQVCAGEMSLVTPNVRSRPHFRHKIESNCAWEPETQDHEAAKWAVCEEINRLGLGRADIEVPLGEFIADVSWSDGNHHVAFEIQRANYTWDKFNQKLLGYADRGIGVVYLFIGDQFYRKSEGCIRLKDIEHRLLAGGVKERFSPRWEDHKASPMEYHRVIPRHSGRTLAGYLRRSSTDEATLLVREPIFTPYITSANWPAVSMVIEAGYSLGGLNNYLREVHNTFLAQPGRFYFNRIWFRDSLEATWAYFFWAVGLNFTYHSQTSAGAAHFVFAGRHRLIAWIKGRRAPSVPEGCNELILEQEPHYRHELLFLGSLSDAYTSDEAILACYTSGSGKPVVDISQFNQSYGGAISGLHDGGVAGGNLGSAIGKRAYDLWLDGQARLSRGVAYPLLTPKFLNGNRTPCLEPRDFTHGYRY